MENDLFSIVGENFFRPLTGRFKSIYLDCLNIIYESYRAELSYGAEREILVSKLTDYFDKSGISDIQFEDDPETLRDSRAKATVFLRKLKEYGWIEYEMANDNSQRIIMPNHAVTMIQALGDIAGKNETEYRGEISAVYSLLTNEELLGRPYPQIIKPVYERTLSLFTGLKKLNTSIRKYIEEITADKTSEEILNDFFEYHDEIGSKAYHRIKTDDNVARFRNTIVRRLKSFWTDPAIFERIVIGYQNVENENDHDTAFEKVGYMFSDIIDHFHSYDDIVKEIDKKHGKYIRNAVERAKFLLLNSNNTEGKISAILQAVAATINRDGADMRDPDDDENLCPPFNLFPQGFLSGESLKAIPFSHKITDIDEIESPSELDVKEREAMRAAIREKNKNRFSKKNITAFVNVLLKDRKSVLASEINVSSRRDMIRVIFINLYGRNPRSSYIVIPSESLVDSNGFRFRDFKIERRIRR